MIIKIASSKPKLCKNSSTHCRESLSDVHIIDFKQNHIICNPIFMALLDDILLKQIHSMTFICNPNYKQLCKTQTYISIT